MTKVDVARTIALISWFFSNAKIISYFIFFIETMDDFIISMSPYFNNSKPSYLKSFKSRFFLLSSQSTNPTIVSWYFTCSIWFYKYTNHQKYGQILPDIVHNYWSHYHNPPSVVAWNRKMYSLEIIASEQVLLIPLTHDMYTSKGITFYLNNKIIQLINSFSIHYW